MVLQNAKANKADQATVVVGNSKAKADADANNKANCRLMAIIPPVGNLTESNLRF